MPGARREQLNLPVTHLQTPTRALQFELVKPKLYDPFTPTATQLAHAASSMCRTCFQVWGCMQS